MVDISEFTYENAKIYIFIVGLVRLQVSYLLLSPLDF